MSDILNYDVKNEWIICECTIYNTYNKFLNLKLMFKKLIAKVDIGIGSPLI